MTILWLPTLFLYSPLSRPFNFEDPLYGSFLNSFNATSIRSRVLPDVESKFFLARLETIIEYELSINEVSRVTYVLYGIC